VQRYKKKSECPDNEAEIVIFWKNITPEIIRIWKKAVEFNEDFTPLQFSA
jgi:hypothetical protein